MDRLDGLDLKWPSPAVSYRKAVAKPLDRCLRETKAVTHLQHVLHLDDGAVQDGGGELRGDGDHLGSHLPAGRRDGLHLVLQDVVGVDPLSALRKEAPLLVQKEFWLHRSIRLVVDFHVHLHVFPWEQKTLDRHPGQSAPMLNICCCTCLDVIPFCAASAFLKYFSFSFFYYRICAHQLI